MVKKDEFLIFLDHWCQQVKTNIPISLAKSVLIALGLTTAASTTDAAIQKKNFGSRVAALIISNNEMNHIIKIVKSLEELGLMIKRITKAIKNDAKKQKIGFLGKLLGTHEASLLGSMLPGKVVIKRGNVVTWAGEGAG